MEIPLIKIRAHELGAKVAQLAQVALPSSEVVGNVESGCNCGETEGTDKGTISGRTCSAASSLSNRFQ